jgi:hypothetical protein
VGLISLAVYALGPKAASAATESFWATPEPLGKPIAQRFVGRNLAIVATNEEKVCVASRRIRIEVSSYLTLGDEIVPFDRIVRSPATSIQAIADAGGIRGFRVQMKYSPAPSRGIFLVIGDTRSEITSTLEPSNDSLWINGAVAARLASAFAAGETPMIQAISRDTDHEVTDFIDSPDLPDLLDCARRLAEDSETAGPSNMIRLVFRGDAQSMPLATLPELQACRMTDPPGRLHVARIASTQGFYAQSDKVFVSFDDAGRIEQLYVPGIFDGDFRSGRTSVRVSKASDANLPTEANRVSGCIGMREMPLCPYRLEEGSFLVAACIEDSFEPTLGIPPDGWEISTLIPPLGTPPGRYTVPPTSTDTVTVPDSWPVGGGISIGTPISGNSSIGTPVTRTGNVPSDTPEIPSVPLPATVYMLSAALALVSGLRKRKPRTLSATGRSNR